MIHVLTILTPDYLHYARGFLRSAAVLDARLWVACLGWEADPEVRQAAPAWHFRGLCRDASDMGGGMVQSGRAIEVIDCLDDADVVVQVDADVRVQRDFLPHERETLDALDKGTLLAEWNGWPGDTLLDEAPRIGLDPATWGGVEYLKSIPCYNFGCVAGRPAAWRRLHLEYEHHWERFAPLSEHRSKVQLLLNGCSRAAGLKMGLLPPGFHVHGHFGRPEGVRWGEDGTAYCRGRAVLFAHALCQYA